MQIIIIIFLAALFFLAVIISHNRSSKALGGIALIFAIILGSLSFFDGIDVKVGTNSTLIEDNRTIINEDVYEPIDSRYSKAIGMTFFITVFYLAWVLSMKEEDEDE